MTRIHAAVPLLRVADVSRTIAWYREHLGFLASPFPDEPPHEFAILENGITEIMVRRVPDFTRDPAAKGWDVYLRLQGGHIRDVYNRLTAKLAIFRSLERMPYGNVEFEIIDPDGYRLCLGELLPDADDLPAAVG